MTKSELLKKKFSSTVEAMEALNLFLENIDKTVNDHRGNYQHLRVIGTQIFEFSNI